MSIEDPIIELARGNASDTLDAGLVITRATSNVAVAYRGDEGELAIGYTQSGASDADVTPIADGGLDVRVYGNLFANNLTTTANVEATYFKGNGSELTHVTLDQVVGYANTTANTIQLTNSDVGLTATGNVEANYFVGDGSKLTGLVTDLQSVTDNGNVTSNTIQFTNATTAFVADSNVGIGTDTPAANLHVVGYQYVNDPPTIANAFDHSDAPLTLTHATPTSTTAINDPKPVLHLTRDGTDGESYGSKASFKMSRYENSGTASRSRLDVALTDGTYTESTVMTLRADGKVGVGTTSPGYTLDVHGSANVGALTATTISGPLTGNATTATTLQTARTIGGVSFDGSGNIDLPGVNTTGNQNTSGNAATATTLQTARTIGGVSFDGSGNIDLPGVNTTGNQNTSGNAATATTLQTARTIGGVSFDGSGNISLPGVNTTGNQNTSGNAATATTLQTARTIGGVSFDGSGNIDLPGVNTTGNQNTSGNAATATQVNNSLTPGSYLTGSAFNGSAAQTFVVDATTTNTANKIVARDASGHINFNQGFSSYLNMSHGVSGATGDTIFYSSYDNYIRKNNATGFRASLNVPTRTGGDASGTWGISISGNAATATTAGACSGSAAQLGGVSLNNIFNNTGGGHGNRSDFDAVPDAGCYYVTGTTNGPNVNSATQYYGMTLGLGSEYGPVKNQTGKYGSQIYWGRNVSSPYINIRYLENGSWGSWQKAAAGYADSAGNAGNATTATTATNQSGGTVSASTGSFSSAVYYNEWLRNNGASASGLYWHNPSNPGYAWHIYPENRADMTLRTGSGNGGIKGTVVDSTARGYIHWTTGNEIGFLNSSRQWSLRCDNNKNVEIYGTTRLYQFAGSRSGTFSGSGTFNLPGDLDYGTTDAPVIGWEIHMVFGFTGTNYGAFYISGCQDTSSSVVGVSEPSSFRIYDTYYGDHSGTAYLTAARETYAPVYYAKIILAQPYYNNVSASSGGGISRHQFTFESAGCHAGFGSTTYQGSGFFTFPTASRRPKYIRFTCNTGSVQGNYMINPLTT
jgi:hypothetical protein